jgi:hypothetical protein
MDVILSLSPKAADLLRDVVDQPHDDLDLSEADHTLLKAISTELQSQLSRGGKPADPIPDSADRAAKAAATAARKALDTADLDPGDPEDAEELTNRAKEAESHE